MTLTNFLIALATLCGIVAGNAPSTFTTIASAAPASPATANDNWLPVCTNCRAYFHVCLKKCNFTEECYVDCNCKLCENKHCQRDCGFTNCCSQGSASMDVSYPLNGEDNGEAGHKVESPVVHSEDRDTPFLTEETHEASLMHPRDDIRIKFYNTFAMCVKLCQTPECHERCITNTCYAPPTQNRECNWNFCSHAKPPTKQSEPAKIPRDDVCIKLYNTFAVCTRTCRTANCQAKCKTDICYAPPTLSGQCSWSFCKNVKPPAKRSEPSLLPRDDDCIKLYNKFAICTRECQTADCQKKCKTDICFAEPTMSGQCRWSFCKNAVPPKN